VIDLDYALVWALHGLATHSDLAAQLVFKGGTCLRKCYFPEYRFSEDLDFTATRRFNLAEFERSVNEALRFTQETSGIEFDAMVGRMKS
jgi:predicted nucleotidyltransferase component of viral defense system